LCLGSASGEPAATATFIRKDPFSPVSKRNWSAPSVRLKN
jgi:hypothetical protein